MEVSAYHCVTRMNIPTNRINVGIIAVMVQLIQQRHYPRQDQYFDGKLPDENFEETRAPERDNWS